MKIGLLKEPAGDARVAMLPQACSELCKAGIELWVEHHAGAGSYAFDEQYQAAGCRLGTRSEVLSCPMLLGIHIPTIDELRQLAAGTIVIGMFQPLANRSTTAILLERKITAFSLDMIPRTTRAQTMDVLSSQATAAGYKAVLMAANHLSRFFPMLMTAAGTLAPARVLVLGAGVAGLQAIATARRLGAVVEAFDTRSAVKEEVLSLGAKFVEVQGAAESAAAGGYAIEQSQEYLRLQQQEIRNRASKADVIICTAQIPGKKAPLLLPHSVVQEMKPGSVIVDLAAATGGNCEDTRAGEIIVTPNGVTIIGLLNLPATLPVDASRMYGNNLLAFLKLILKQGQPVFDFNDDIVQATCITHQGELIASAVKQALSQPIA